MEEIMGWTLYKKEEQELLIDMEYQGYSRKGYVYILEYGDMLKIGATSKPYLRLKNLASLAEKYSNTSVGLMALSPAHYNYYENEKRLHNFFTLKRFKNGELFHLTISDFFKEINDAKLKYITKDENCVDSEKFIKMMLHTDEEVPKKCKKSYMPMYICWEEEFGLRAFRLFIEERIEVGEFLEGLFLFLNEQFDINKLSKEYKNETCSKKFNIYDLCSYFPELRDLANEYLNILENNY